MNHQGNSIRIGTRRSKLALVQTEMVCKALSPAVQSDVVEIVTTGDRLQKDELACRDKREWVLEIERALVEGEIDLAVHSAKDVPVDLEPGTAVSSIFRRASPFDAFIPKHLGASFESLAPGSVVGTSSLRRIAQLRRLRPDLQVQALRGNVPTRIAKVREGDTYDACVLAMAGIERLELENVAAVTFSSEQILPAVNQGILLVQFREDDRETRELVAEHCDLKTEIACRTERSFVQHVGADCRSSVGVFAEVGSDELLLTARVLSEDGSKCLEYGERLEHREAIRLQTSDESSNTLEKNNTVEDGAVEDGAVEDGAVEDWSSFEDLAQRVAEKLLAEGAGDLI